MVNGSVSGAMFVSSKLERKYCWGGISGQIVGKGIVFWGKFSCELVDKFKDCYRDCQIIQLDGKNICIYRRLDSAFLYRLTCCVFPFVKGWCPCYGSYASLQKFGNLLSSLETF